VADYKNYENEPFCDTFFFGNRYKLYSVSQKYIPFDDQSRGLGHYGAYLLSEGRSIIIKVFLFESEHIFENQFN
jgi:hypothetical protein